MRQSLGLRRPEAHNPLSQNSHHRYQYQMLVCAMAKDNLLCLSKIQWEKANIGRCCDKAAGMLSMLYLSVVR